MAPTLDLIFAALSDPTRRAILMLLLEDDMTVTDVAASFPVSLAAISRHLAILGRAGLIAQERSGRLTWCKLDPDAMRAASVWMQSFGQFEPVHLDSFERFLSRELRPSTLGSSKNEAGDRDDGNDKPDDIDDAIPGNPSG
ncbi:transcriptional regulator, ArsR family [Oceaniovalibus guishaninsula JLT2003]|uniref:Transcriptional regulator, ArsR family n=1 Tax=Oceaniovalibus guishaninsula JLT2003 TaxID=1231392 RepID=K2GT24_9RHOB|nr:metalloregulator ArsR/SmtB family transcription factor [Oceaniovalibus guishaninsula]EKE45676.1 transcriptional regulator, ArsR family [Oceaniovalibus guishaninsula JLT2003]